MTRRNRIQPDKGFPVCLLWGRRESFFNTPEYLLPKAISHTKPKFSLLFELPEGSMGVIMKKTISISILLVVIVMSLTSCMTVDQVMNEETADIPDLDNQENNTSSGGSGVSERFQYMKADLSEYVTLSAYTGLSVEVEYVEVSDEELDGAVNSIKKQYGVEEITDEVASIVSDGECTSAEGFREYYREVYRESLYRTVAMNTLLSSIAGESEFKKLPESEVNYYYADLRLQYEALALLRGIEYENEDELYAAFGTTYADVRNQARQYVREDLVLYSIIQRENIMFSDDDYDSVLTENAAYNLAQSPDFLLSVGYDESNLENMKDYIDKNFSEQIITACLEEKMKDYLLKNNTVTELPKDEDETDTSAAG